MSGEQEFEKPLFFQLTSSLNVELVYVILKSITQFAYYQKQDDGDASGRTQSKKKLDTLKLDQSTGDAQLSISKIKVKNQALWQTGGHRPSMIGSTPQEETLVIDSNVKVTYYRMLSFMDTFSDYLSNFQVLHQSLSPKFNRDMVFKAGEGAGRSGSFFFFSHDHKFIIKTMTAGELKLYLKIHQRLAKHYEKVPCSLLAKIFGVFTVKMRNCDAVHIMLMENALQLKSPERLRYIFDLKGSLVDRKVKGKTKPSTTLKDINFIMAAKSNPNLTSFTPRDQKKLRATVSKDVAFLQSEGLMDYSLLLAIETLQKKPEEPGLIHKT